MPQRTFWFALAVSLAVHAALFAGLPGVISSDHTPVRQPLVAELRPPAYPASPQPAVRPARKRAPPQQAALPAPVSQAVERAAPGKPEPIVQEPPHASEPVTESPAAVEPSEPLPAPSVVEAPAAVTPLDIEPSSGTITYELFYGGGGIGRSVQTWRIDRTSYRLTSLSEPVGLVALFLPYQFSYTSEGKIGPEGLLPEHFTARSGRGGSRQSAARFDWLNGEIALGNTGALHKQPLPAGTQDLLSFVYQIALAPEVTPGRRSMVITSGTKVDTYVLDIGPEEAIDLPVGPMRAIPIRRVARPGEESMQLWLASTPPRLPVRIRFFDRAGKMTIEQLAAKIEPNGS